MSGLKGKAKRSQGGWSWRCVECGEAGRARSRAAALQVFELHYRKCAPPLPADSGRVYGPAPKHEDAPGVNQGHPKT